MREKGTDGQGVPLVREDLQRLTTSSPLLWLFPLPGTCVLREHLSDSFPDPFISHSNPHTFPCSSSSSAFITFKYVIRIDLLLSIPPTFLSQWLKFCLLCSLLGFQHLELSLAHSSV